MARMEQRHEWFCNSKLQNAVSGMRCKEIRDGHLYDLKSVRIAEVRSTVKNKFFIDKCICPANIVPAAQISQAVRKA